MKIDISNLIDDLVEATVKSLKEKEKENDTGVDPNASPGRVSLSCIWEYDMTGL